MGRRKMGGSKVVTPENSLKTDKNGV